MSTKISITGIAARDKALKGANYVADAVKSTLGPFGLNGMLEKENTITNDGFKLSSALAGTIKDEFERRGAIIFHETSSKTNDEVGDATTTSEVLGQAIIKEAIRYLPSANTIAGKKTPSELRKMIKNSLNEVNKILESKIKNVENEQELINSALVSVEDEELADLIGKTQWKLGADGVIIAEATTEKESSIQVVKGVRIDNGFGASFMINNQEKQTLEVNEASVIMTNYTLSDFTPLQSILDQIVKMGKRDIIIIARGFTSECIKLCAENHKVGIRVYPINAPYTDQAEIMRDLASVLGGRYIDQEEGSLDDLQLSDVGFAEKLIARRYDAIITGKEDGNYRVPKRIEMLRKALSGEASEFQKKNLEARISQLMHGFAVLKVGSTSDADRKYKKDKADDAVNAVRLALKGGTIRGAGIALKEISETLSDDNILKRPLTSIFDQIMSSAPEGWEVEEWVRDPFLVIKCALKNACDTAMIFSTTNIIITSENPKQCSCSQGNNEE